MRITYVGTSSGTSLHRIKALERLTHEVQAVDPYEYLAPWEWATRLVVKTGGLGAGLYAYGAIARRVKQTMPDLIWVDHGALLGPRLIRSFRQIGVPVVNYMIDNAWSSIYRRKCHHYRAAIPFYDLVVQVRASGVDAARKAGARNVHLAHHSADEVAHRPRNLTDVEQKQYASQVAFIGTWFPERGPILAKLVRHGVRLSIWGDRWTRAPEWNALAPHWRGGALNDADSYAAAIQSAKICIGLVSKQVKDDVTSRSHEIPALGGLFCGERTAAHRALYEEGEEAVFWSSAEECAAICRELLADEPRRAAIARRGHERSLKNGYYNEQELAKILDKVRDFGPR